MVDRFFVWVGATVVTAGLSAAMLAGAGVAIATDGTPSDTGGSSTSESSSSTDTKGDSSPGAAEADKPSANDPDPKDDTDPTDDESDGDDSSTDTESSTDTDEDATDEDTTEDAATDPDEGTGEPGDSAKPSEADTTNGSDSDDADDTQRARVKPTAAFVQAEAEEKQSVARKVVETSSEPETTVEQAVVVLNEAVAKDVDTPEIAAVAFASAVEMQADATASASPMTGLLNVIGTIVFNLYNFATRLVGGPPILPANSGVTVRSSTLRIDCGCAEGDGFEVPADWYVPDVVEDDRLIYLQHGFLAQGPWYSYTAAALAKQTKSIVVAPSITSNFLAADACWLGAPPMHEAMAKLFDDGNTALADSAEAAGYLGPIPDRVVLIGHSLGGGAVAGIAGNMVTNGTVDRLAGVIMLDGVPFDPKAVESIGSVPVDIPFYQLAAPGYFWNQFGVGTDALHQARPDQFIGVTLAGGSHVDSMRGGNPLIQFAQELVAGFTSPKNAAAAEIVMVGWANDMFAENQGDQRVGVYLDRGEEFTLDTPAGQATLVDLPNSLTKSFPLNFVKPFISIGNGFFTFEPACVNESVAMSSCGAGSLAA
jgi:pimeloyl-ACP methyl ester carboxylesterase